MTIQTGCSQLNGTASAAGTSGVEIETTARTPNDMRGPLSVMRLEPIRYSGSAAMR